MSRGTGPVQVHPSGRDIAREDSNCGKVWGQESRVRGGGGEREKYD